MPWAAGSHFPLLRGLELEEPVDLPDTQLYKVAWEGWRVTRLFYRQDLVLSQEGDFYLHCLYPLVPRDLKPTATPTSACVWSSIDLLLRDFS